MTTEIDVASVGEDLPLLEGIRTNRAVRRLRPDPVPPELIRKVCEAGTFAPSGVNRQPWIFIAVTEAERRAWVADRYRAVFREYAERVRETVAAPTFPAAQRKNYESALHLADHMHEVPVLLFVAGRKRDGRPQTQALFPAIQNVLLACRAVGLGASLTTIHTRFGDECDPWLGLPENHSSVAMLPIGWPIGGFWKPLRRPVDECLFFERYGKRARSVGPLE